MKLHILLFFVLIANLGEFFAQDIQKLKKYNQKSSYYLTTFDSSLINKNIANTVITKFGFSQFGGNDSLKLYRFRSGANIFITTFSVNQYISKINSDFKIGENIVSLKPNDKIYIYGFKSFLSEGNKVDKNFSKLLMSSYLQEIDKEYFNNNNNFTSFAIKDKRIFWKRNMINMGYGMSYLAKDNHFMGSKKLAVGFFYIWETLHYIPIFGGAFLGKTKQDKIEIPIIGISSLIVWKTLFSGVILGNRYLKINKKIKDSGYKIPSNIK